MQMSLNDLFNELEWNYLEKAKLVKRINRMKRSNISYNESQRLDDPVYSIKWAKNHLAQCELQYHTKLNLFQCQSDKNIAKDSAKRITCIKGPEFDMFAKLIMKISQARQHYKYVLIAYRSYKARLKLVNEKINYLKNVIHHYEKNYENELVN
jgi:hypothetical protein